ncbi:MAG: hypothetical protein PHY02_10885 [Phycisphaerae bacterium]|nr:hypothetical protein [Phycisphaerae bacterium]
MNIEENKEQLNNLETIEKYQERKIKEIFEKNKSGIACPKCGKEMILGNYALGTNPLKRSASCECGHKEIVLA